MRGIDRVALLKAVAEFKGEADDDGAGYCIRCSTEIDFDLDRPYCRPHAKRWAAEQKKDDNYREKFCHDCGDNYRATFKRPVCGDCFKASA